MGQQWRIDGPDTFSGRKRKSKGLNPIHDSSGIDCEVSNDTSHSGHARHLEELLCKAEAAHKSMRAASPSRP